MSHRHTLLFTRLPSALLLASVFGCTATSAQGSAEAVPTEREQALEARVESLERMVRELLAARDVDAAPVSPPAAAPVNAAVPAPAIQTTPINTAG